MQEMACVLQQRNEMGPQSCILHRYEMVKNIPVNYAMRASGPVTTLTARRLWYGV
jgi:hypothetical protein